MPLPYFIFPHSTYPMISMITGCSQAVFYPLEYVLGTILIIWSLDSKQCRSPSTKFTNAHMTEAFMTQTKQLHFELE